ncbi:MAG: hypothetical protein IM526_02820 [Microcystis sp. M38BS1]|uniref:hypothetical protein n=1 Tax=Microcystis sp. M38BS1 TaxID=2771188 RepID=UPI0031FDE765|nr:hypothetical protein [Microcystis sp. M38BS1]MCA6582594.1 hypothetical protein [Pseudanabaena sp. M34BS1SP1A06MG]
MENQLKAPNLPKMKQGAMKPMFGERLPQARMGATNKKSGGFTAPVVKRRKGVISAGMGKNMTFAHMNTDIASFSSAHTSLLSAPAKSNVAEFLNLTGRQRYYSIDDIPDDELAEMTDQQINEAIHRQQEVEAKNKIRESANARANYRAKLDTFREGKSAIRQGYLPYVGKLLYG